MSGSSTSRNPRRAHAGWLHAQGIAAIVLCLAAAGQASGAERALSQFIRDSWQSDKGFPGGRVYAITQTADGYLWIGAEKGLVRFDGLTFRLFDPNASSNRTGPTVLGVAAAPDGSLWARLRGAALVRYRHGRFENILSSIGPPESVVSAMTASEDGTMLLATLGRGAVVHRNQRFDAMVPPAMMPGSSFVISLAQGANGDFWLGTRDAGLMRVTGGQVTRLTAGLPDFKVNCLLAFDDGTVWVGTDKGVVRWTGTELTRAQVPAELHTLPALTMIRDGDGAVWIAAGAKGLLRVNRNGAVAAAGWLPPVSTVFADRDGNLWVGTDRGIERWRDPVFTSFTSDQGLPPEAVGPVHVDRSGRTWFGSSAGGLYRLDAGRIAPVDSAGLPRDVVYSIDGSGDEVWVGRRRGGLTRLRLDGPGVSARAFTQADGLAQDSVYAVHRARDGAVWAGTLSGGVTRVKDGALASYDTADGLASNTVAAILDTADGTVWFGTPTGLSSLSRARWRTYTTVDGLPANDVNVLFEDDAGRLWLGTANGLGVLEAGNVRPLGSVPSILRTAILGIAGDRSRTLWVATVDRILRVDRDALLRGAVDADVREYSIGDGLPGLESVKRQRTVVADARGRIWFALNQGLAVADPERSDARQRPALTHVEGLSADGISVNLQSPIRIPSSRRRLTFEYAGLSLGLPERVRFRYRLDGFDADWSEPVQSRQAVYTNLRPGPYRFRVMASNSDGLWNGSEATLSLDIAPMFWQTAWFTVILALVAAAGGWGVYRLRVRQIARELSMRFDERLAERTHIAQELHDTLLQGFVSASMQLHVAADRLPDDSPVKAPISRVLDLMRRVTEEGRNAVRGLRGPGTGPDGLEEAFSRIQQEVGDTHAAFHVVVQGRPRPLTPIVRDEVYRIGREALVNAFRHSRAASVEIEIEYAPAELRMFVRDDGSGIDQQVLAQGTDGHWGLTGMRERADRIGAALKIRSRAAAGTEAELRVPGRLAYESEPIGRRARRRGSPGEPGSGAAPDVNVEKPR